MSFSLELYIATVFCVVLMSEFWNVPVKIKRLFKISELKMVKPLDCLPCFSFWISACTLNVFVMMSVFVTFYLIDKIIYND